jgi:Alginate lyase
MAEIEFPRSSAGPATALDEADRNTPGDLLDLSKWYLALPIADPDGRRDRPWNVYQPELGTFNHPKFFCLVDGAVEYVAPVKGVTTSGAEATRCELREMKGPGRDNEASWGFNDHKTHRLTCTLTCDPTSVNGRKECIVGQIHDKTGRPPIYLAVNMNNVPGKLTLFKSGHGTTVLTGLRPADTFTYRIEVTGGRCRIWAARGEVSDLPSSPNFNFPASDFQAQSEGCYFKAGAYNKEPAEGSPPGRSVVRHYRLDLA